MTRPTQPMARGTERDLTWIAEANSWAKAMTTEYFESHRTGLHTVADVLAWLDDRGRDLVHWARWLGFYQTRYQMVRHGCIALAREGYLESSSTVNAKGRDAVAYHYAGASDAWAIEVAPPDQAERVSGMVRRWLYDHRHELRDVGSISVTLKESSKTHVTKAGPAPGGPIVRRRIARGSRVPGPSGD